VALMQLPAVMSAPVPVAVFSIDVELVKVTVTSPLAVLRVSVEPLICASFPSVPPPRNAPGPVGNVEVLPHAATAQHSAATMPTLIRGFMTGILACLPFFRMTGHGGGAGRDSAGARQGRGGELVEWVDSTSGHLSDR
jgi:hypothetical protein